MVWIPLACIDTHRGGPMKSRGVLWLSLSLVMQALISACGGSSSAASVDASCADVHTTVDAALGVDPGRIGMCDPDRVRPAGTGYALDSCRSDVDCVDGVNGRCNFMGPAWTTCSYDECFTDADCPTGTRCACGVGPSDANACLPDDCCACDVAHCGVSWACFGLTFPVALECHTSHDACQSDADCAGRGEFCTYEPHDSLDLAGWRCTPPWCAF